MSQSFVYRNGNAADNLSDRKAASAAFGAIRASVSYFGTEIGRFDFCQTTSLPDIISYIKATLKGVGGMVTITLRNIVDGSMSRHRLMLGTSLSRKPGRVQLTLF